MLECVHITERGDKYVTSDLANGGFITPIRDVDHNTF